VVENEDAIEKIYQLSSIHLTRKRVENNDRGRWLKLGSPAETQEKKISIGLLDR